ncbi:MFS transporter [Paenarthrobacter sp. S56]|uniref:MFS transporter n=1 Tax=Paenarthrobacter sp. S56 TaxID=3138179 RepID=UPI003219FA14
MTETQKISGRRVQRNRFYAARLGPARGFWLIAASFAVMMAFTTVPTPLYALYQQRDGFPAVTTSVIFAIYGIGVLASVFLAGHLSDQLGRRPMMLAAAASFLAAAILFVGSQEVAVLLVARLMTGVGVGLLSVTATAYLNDLRDSQGRPLELAATIGGIANVGGLALGPAFGGALAKWADQPLITPYAIFIVALAAVIVAIALTPETVQLPEERALWRPQRVRVPAGEMTAFWAAGIGAFATSAILGFFGSVAPTFLSRVIANPDTLLAGMVACAVFASAAASQALLSRLALRLQLRSGIIAMIAGMAGIAAGNLLPSLPVFLAGTVFAGIGVGLVFRSALATAGRIAAPDQRGQVLAGVFLLAYAGMTVPAILVGVVRIWFPFQLVAVGFACLIILLVLWAGPLMCRRIASTPRVPLTDAK